MPGQSDGFASGFCFGFMRGAGGEPSLKAEMCNEKRAHENIRICAVLLPVFAARVNSAIRLDSTA